MAQPEELFLYELCLRLGKTITELHESMTQSELLRWQIVLNQELWQHRITHETVEGRSRAIQNIIMGSR
jgi:hypothetical protein